MRGVLSRLTYANVISTLCLVLILGGGAAYAANTIGSTDIINGEVKSVDIGNNQVYSADVRDDTLAGGGLGAPDLRAGSVRASEVLNDSATGGGLAASDLRPDSVGPSEATGLTGADIANAASGSDDVNADTLDGIDSSQLKGARAYGITGGTFCPGVPVDFCQVFHNIGIAYVVEVAEGIYCVGVDGISAADDNVALLDVQGRADAFAVWRYVNSSCASQEFEIITGTGNDDASRVFTIVIP